MSLSDLTIQSGKPKELYQIVQGADSWFFTDARLPITYSSVEYTPTNISRTEVDQDTDLFKAGITLTLIRTNSFATQFFKYLSEEPTIVTIYRGQEDSYDVYWKGRVVSSTGRGSHINIVCESIYTAVLRPGLRMRIEKLCRHILYDQGCKINREAYKVTSTVQTVSDDGMTLVFDTIGTFYDGYFTAGAVRYGATDTRFIAGHTSNTIVLTRPFKNLIGNTTLVLYPGCNKTLGVCDTKFDNLLNHGGFPYIPTLNPFRISGLF